MIFNRPDTTERVFAEIAKAKPAKLLVVADGPRGEKTGEDQKCAAARAVIDRVDWDCEVLKNYSDSNLGCKKRVSSGIDWVFEQVEEAIILEDDCLPNQTFFRFCDELLERYRDDERIMQICGANTLFGWRRNEASYYFSKYGPIWGWASWRRAWKYYDVDMKSWPEVKAMHLPIDFCDSPEEISIRTALFDRVFNGGISTWDFQWVYAKLLYSGLCIVPNVNLISNIGFRDDATHTKTTESLLSDIKAEDLGFPLHHPTYILKDSISDGKYFNLHIKNKKLSLLRRIANRIFFYRNVACS